MEEFIEGGLAEGKPCSEFPKDQILKGVKVEMEHTNDPAIAKEISKDHLVENKLYYDYLEDMEKSMEKESNFIGLRNIDELLTLATDIKQGSIDDYFRKEIRDIISCLLDSEFDLTEEQIIKFAEEEIEQLISNSTPKFRQNNMKLYFLPEIKAEYENLKNKKRSK